MSWIIQFTLCEVAAFVMALVLYGWAGPAGAILWAVATFAFGAMWATGRKAISK